MAQVSDVVWVNCSDCGNTLNGNARGALRWTRCPACSSSRLAFAAPFSAPDCPPAQPGQLLSRWQAEYRTAAGLPSPQPAYGPKAAPKPAAVPAPPPVVSEAQIPTPIAVPVLPPGQYPPVQHADAPYPPGQYPPEQAPPQRPRRTPTGMAPGLPGAPKQASKTLVIVRLLVAFGAILVAGVILVVFMLTKDQKQEQTATDDPQTPVTPRNALPTNRASNLRQPQPDQSKLLAKKASADYLEKLPGRVEMFQLRTAALTEAYNEMTSAHEAWRTAELNQAAANQQAALGRRTEAEAERLKAEKQMQAAEASLKRLRAEQSPLSRFVLAYGALDPRLEAYDAAKAAARASSQARSEADDAHSALETKLLEATDTTTQVRLEKELNAARETLDAAITTDGAAQEALQARRTELGEARAELDGAAALVSSETAEGAALQPAWASYMKASAGIREAESVQEAAEARIVELKGELDLAQSSAADKRATYKDTHARYLEVAGDLSRAVIAFRNNPTLANKKKAEDLKVAADKARDEDNRAKDEMNAADKAVRETKDSIRRAEREGPKLQEAVDAAVKAAAGSKSKFEVVLEPIRGRVARDETARNDEIARLDATVRAARDRRADQDAKIKEATEEIDGCRVMTTALEKLADVFATAQVAQLEGPPGAAMAKLLEMLNGLLKLEYLTPKQAGAVVDKLTLIEAALNSIMVITSRPDFVIRFEGAAESALEKWRSASAGAVAVATDLREATATLSVILGGTKVG